MADNGYVLEAWGYAGTVPVFDEIPLAKENLVESIA